MGEWEHSAAWVKAKAFSVTLYYFSALKYYPGAKADVNSTRAGTPYEIWLIEYKISLIQ